MSREPASADDLSRAKAQLLERLMRGRALATPRPDVITRGDGDTAPLSFAQQQLWFLDQIESGSSLYNVSVAVRLRGALDRAAFGASLWRVLSRHESMRTSFASRDGEPYQVIAPSLPAVLSMLDLTDVAPDRREALAADIVANDTARPFDLSRAPLVRARLVRLDRTEHVLGLVLHHIVADGWSLGLLTGQLRVEYTAALGDAPAAAGPASGIRYVDYAAWQRRRLRGDGLAGEIAHWRDRLAGAPTLLELPGDRPRPAVQTFRGAHHGASWALGERRAVRDFSRQVGASDFMTLLAAFAVVLARYSGSDDLVIGVPTAGRTRPELQDVVGLFVNTVPVRVRIDERRGFRELVTHVRAEMLAVYDHQDVPFDRLVDALVPDRDLSYSPLVQVMFELRSAPAGDPAHWPGLTLRTFGELPPGDTAKFDITLTAADAENGYELSAEYSSDLFDAETVDQMLGHLRHLLAAALARPDDPLSSIGLHSDDEAQRLLRELNPAEGVPAGAPALPVVIAEHARRRADAIAVTHGERQLSYGALWARAKRLAAVLRTHGVGSETRVGLCLTKRPELVVAVLATMLAGGAYVPMDPAYPAQRVAFMLGDSRIRVLLTEAGTAELLDEAITRSGAVVVDIDAALAELARDPLAQPHPAPPVGVPAEPLAQSLAYVIYTSGSTGTPRGVQIGHAQLAAALASWQHEYALTPSDRHLQLASPAFDVFTGDLTRALGSGATLVLADRDLLLDPAGLADHADERQITCAEFVPVVLRHLVGELERQQRTLPTLRLLVAGSDAWHAADHTRARRVGGPRTRLLNSYGLTEATVDSTYFEGEAGGTGDAPAPIGRPMRHARAYVLDASGRPAPLGVPGELCIGGPGVGRGYLGKPGRTAAVFAPDPFAGHPGARLYRTGDRARWRRTGELEFLGRTDHQVKLRGFRIELGEVEAVLAGDDRVAAALAVVRRDPAGAERLVGYVVPVGTPDPDELAAQLRAAAGARLPDYMVPSAIVALNALPLTPNGKLDRSALPEPSFGELAGGDEAPATECEHALAAVWAEVLGRERVGVEDNFFSLGGDSIVSLQVVARSRAAGWAITPRHVFEHQTVRGLAGVATPVGESAAQADQGEVVGTLPLTAIQHELLTAGLPNPHHYNMSVLLAARESVDPVALNQAVLAVVRHHDALRLRFTTDRTGAGQHHQHWQQFQCGAQVLPAAPVQVVDLAGLPADVRAATIEAASAAAQRSLRLDSGLLLRALHFTGDAPGDDRVLLAVHHLAVDGVSWRVVLEDLDRAYRSASRGEPIRLAAKTTSFRDWARRAAEEADSAQTLAETDHWLAVAAATTPLPRDVPAEPGATAPSGTGATTESVALKLDAELTRALLEDVPTAYRTGIDDALLSAMAQAVRPWTGSRTLVVDSERHGREGIADDLDVTRTVGWFTSTHPVLLDLGPDDDQGVMLCRIKEQLRAVPRHGVGWGLLRQVSTRAAQQLRDAPRAELAFNYLGQFDSSFGGPSLWEPAPESAGPDHDPDEPREYPIEITALVTRGQLEFVWSYSRDRHRRETIESLAQRLAQALRAIVEHCARVMPGRATPSDFPLARVSQPELDRILAAGDVQDVYALTPLQQGMLFHGLADPQAGAYLEQFTATLQGDLDVAAFRAAWADVVARHSALRASFHWEGLAEPVQAVHATVELEWNELDWRDLDEPARAERWAALLAADRARGFALDTAPLLRFVLASAAGGERWLLFSHHHVLLDGWSFRQVLSEVLLAYAARRRGEPPAFAPVRQYRDHVAWLARHEGGASDEQFWRDQLRDHRPPARPGDGIPRGEHAFVRRVIGPQRTAELAEFARRNQLTMNTVVQGAWALTLARHTGVDDVVHGMTLSGRPAELPGVEDIVGLFINTVPIRTVVPRRGTVLGWLRELQDRLLEVRAHESTPLTRIGECAGIGPDEDLFDTLVVFENYPVDTATADDHGSGMSVSRSSTHTRTNFATTLTLAPGEQIPLELSHDLGVLSAEGGAALLDRFVATLDALAAQPGAAPTELMIAELDLAGGRERDRLLADCLGPAPLRPEASTITELFARRVAATPGASALVADGVELSYAQLDARANRLAQRLIRTGVRPRDRVALLVERGVEQIAATLAVLKAGATYVPLDTRYPDARLGTVLARIEASAVVADTVHAERAAALPWAAPLVPTRDDLNNPAIDPGVAVHPGDLAYVVFTSGSTGEPKGVAVSHDDVVALALDATFDSAHERVLVHSPHAFDASTYEIWAPLLTGRTGVLAPAGELTADRIEQLVGEQGVTVAFLTTGLFRVVAEQRPHALRGLAQVWTGGDAVPVESVRRVQEACPELTVFDVYGPTETTTFATCHRLARGPDLVAPLPIGRPLDGRRAYVLDAALRLAPAGAPGELFLAGAGVARGYLGDPAQTAERFVPDPFGPPGARMYRTGDLTWWDGSGALRFAGRRDDQVKVRGFRLELEEVELALRAVPGVRDAVVTAPVDRHGDRSLVGHLVAEADISLVEVREHCAAVLPEYMTPGRFVVHDRLPLTANGKLDRAALAVAEQSAGPAQPVGTPELPQTPREAVVAGLMAEALDGQAIGRDDDFFMAGGHSLAALRLVGRLREVFGRDIALAEVFRTRTVAALAEALDEALDGSLHGGPAAARPETVVPLRGGNDAAPLICIHPKNGTVFCYTTLARSLGERRAVLGIQSVTVAARAAAQDSIPELARTYLADLLRVQPHGPYHLLGYSLGGMIAFELAHLLRARGEQVALLALLDCAPRLDGPPFPDPAELDAMDDAEFLALEFGEHVRIDVDELRALGPVEQLRHVAARLDAAGLPAEHMDLDTMQRYVEIARAHTRAAISYEPRPYPGHAALLRCADPDEVSGGDRSWGWADLVDELRIVDLPGTHVTVLDEPNVAEVVAQLRALAPAHRPDGTTR